MNVSRRNLLAAGSSAMAGAAVVSGQASTAAAQAALLPAAPGLSLALANHVVRTRYEDLPADVSEMTKRSILDAIGVSLASSGLEPACDPFVDLAVELGGKGEATILGRGLRAPANQAVFANGAFAHAMDYEDSHEASRTHPNAAAVAAALAVAETAGPVSGKDLIVAVALGCDMVCRLAMAEVPAPGQKGNPPGFYRPAVVGTLGAATAAAKLYKLNAAQVLDAFSLAICQNSVSGEILNAPDSTMRAVRDGFCAQSGVVAAQLAQRGVKGFDQPFEGKSGYFVMFMGGRYDPAVMTKDLGRAFAGRDIAFKPWPACRDTHLYIQAAFELMAQQPIKTDDIAAIEVVVADRNLIVCEPAASKKAPRTAIDAKFSVYFTVARALLYREIVFPSFWDDARADARTLALASKVSYLIDPQAANPVAQGGDVVMIVTLKDGTVLRRKVQALSGSLDAPLSAEALRTKFVDCGRQAKRPLTVAQLDAVSREIMAIDSAADVAPLIRRL